MNTTRSSIDSLLVAHPPGTIRVLSPTEEAALDQLAASATVARVADTALNGPRPILARIGEVLRNFARVWVSAQVHRAGL